MLYNASYRYDIHSDFVKTVSGGREGRGEGRDEICLYKHD